MSHACTKDIHELAAIDEVVAFALRMQKAREAEEKYEVIKSRAKRENNVTVETYSESAMFQHGDTAEAARNMLSVVKASTLAGAAIQICDAINRIDWIDNGAGDTGDEIRAIERLLYSALTIVEARAGLKVSDIARSISSPYTNPWVPAEERCPALADKAA